MASHTLEFWFEFASTYSYVTASRIEAVAHRANVTLAWRPFLLGPIFQAQGWDTSPFNIYEAKGRYMWRDMERLCEAQGIALNRPAIFPQNGLTAARIALAAQDEPWLPAFCKAVYEVEFVEGRDISETATLRTCLERSGADPERWFARSQERDVKTALKEQTARAIKLGIFGAPSFIANDELFWGNDRLEEAVDWLTAGK